MTYPPPNERFFPRLSRLLILAASFIAVSSMHAVQYTLVDIGITQYRGYGGGLDINNFGVVVGTQANAPQFNAGDRAVMWSSSLGLTELGTLGGTWSTALGINDAGQVVGYSELGGASLNKYHGFVWSSAEGMKDVGTLGATGSRVEDINESGLAVGTDHLASGRAFAWTEATGMSNIGSLGADGTQAFAVNDSGQVVGWSRGVSTPSHAFVWSQSAGMKDLGSGDAVSDAFDINNAGIVVGRNLDAVGTGGNKAVMWDASGNMTTLGNGFAVGINETNQIVGYRTEGAFLWEAGLGQQRLTIVDPLLGVLERADAINDHGQIVGWVNDGTNNNLLRAVLLTPTGLGQTADVVTTLEWPSLPPPPPSVPDRSSTAALLGITLFIALALRGALPRRRLPGGPVVLR